MGRACLWFGLVALWPPAVYGLLVEMVPYELSTMDQAAFEEKYTDLSYPVRQLRVRNAADSRHCFQVLLKDGAADWKALKWGIDGLVKRCGERRLNKCKVGEHKVHPGFTGWVRYPESIKPVNLTQYEIDNKVVLETLADLVRLQRQGHKLHLHKAIADVICHELIDDTLVPPQFLHDYGTQLPVDISESRTHRCPGSMTTFAQTPLIQMGPKGVTAPTHVEKGARRIWIAMIEGSATVRMCHVDDLRHLKPKIPEEDDWNVHPNHFHVDLFQPDYEQYPHLKQLRIMETPLKKGEVVFVPEGWAYQVYNDKTSVTMSHTFVDRQALPKHMHWLYNSMWHRTPDARKLPERERLQRELQYIWYHSNECANHMGQYLVAAETNRTWNHFFSSQRYVLEKGKTLFDLFPEQEFDELMKLGVGNQKTGLEDGSSKHDAWARFREDLHDATGEGGNSGPNIHQMLALGETLPSTFGQDPHGSVDHDDL